MDLRRLLLNIFCLYLALALGACPRPGKGSLAVTLGPQDAVASGAQWRVDGGAWQSSGDTVTGLSEGPHTVECRDVTGWYAPPPEDVAVTPAVCATRTATYLPGHPDWAEDSFTCDVTLAPETVYVDESQLGVLLNPSAKGGTYAFDAAEADAQGLVFTEGEPLLIYGVDACRIAAVSRSGGVITVETEFAPLGEVISDGVLEWDYGVEFTPEKVAAVSWAGKRFPIGKDDRVIEQDFTVGDLDYHLKLNLQGPIAGIEFTVEKKVAGSVKGKFVAKGRMTRFRSRNAIELSGGNVQSFENGIGGLRGDVRLSLVVAASGEDFVDYKLPVPLLEFPFMVGAMPVTLKLGAQFVINATVPFDGSSRVTTGFTYDADMGLSFDGVDVETSGGLAGIDLEEGVTETGASSAISANFGLGFPRLSVSLFKDSVVPWAQTAALVGGSYTVYPACQTAEALFLGAAGIDLKFLGYPLASGSHTFFEHKEELLRTGECPEETKRRMWSEHGLRLSAGEPCGCP